MRSFRPCDTRGSWALGRFATTHLPVPRSNATALNAVSGAARVDQPPTASRLPVAGRPVSTEQRKICNKAVDDTGSIQPRSDRRDDAAFSKHSPVIPERAAGGQRTGFYGKSPLNRVSADVQPRNIGLPKRKRCWCAGGRTPRWQR